MPVDFSIGIIGNLKKIKENSRIWTAGRPEILQKSPKFFENLPKSWTGPARDWDFSDFPSRAGSGRPSRREIGRNCRGAPDRFQNRKNECWKRCTRWMQTYWKLKWLKEFLEKIRFPHPYDDFEMTSPRSPTRVGPGSIQLADGLDSCWFFNRNH